MLIWGTDVDTCPCVRVCCIFTITPDPGRGRVVLLDIAISELVDGVNGHSGGEDQTKHGDIERKKGK